MRRALPWIVGGALVVGAGALTAATPSDDSLQGAFGIHGAVGTTVASRDLVVTVTGATFSDEVVGPDPEWSADGNWLIVTLVAAAPTTEVDAAINLPTLAVADRVFQASERPSDSLQGTPLRVGLDTVGTLAFELPDDLRAGAAELRLTPSFFTPELDDLVTVSLDLGELPRADSVELESPEWTAP